MKTFFLALVLALPLLGFSQDLTLPATPTDPTAWTDADVFWCGFKLGLVIGGSAFALRVIRQLGTKSPRV